MKGEPRNYTDADLYGPGGRPQDSDIEQDRLFDCYLLAPMGAIAARQPERIQDAIQYQADTQNPGNSTFIVNLYNPSRPGEVQPISVTQDEIRDNIRRGSGSQVDSAAGGGALWPAVMETAFVKMYDSDPQRHGLAEGYRDTTQESGGGSLSDGLYALTGSSGTSFNINGAPPFPRSSGGAQEREYEAPTIRSPPLDLGPARVEINRALLAGQPVTLATRSIDVKDGLERHHAYMVTAIKEVGGDTMITLRNPYATNNRTDESGATANAQITVNLGEVVRKGGLGEINIGPMPDWRPQVPASSDPAQPAPVPSAPAAGLTGERNQRAAIALLDSVGGDAAEFRRATAQAARGGRELFENDAEHQQAHQAQSAVTVAPQAQEAAAPAPDQAAPARRM